jgi:hypothetical protein
MAPDSRKSDELRAAVVAFGSAGQLAEDHDRNFKLLGQAFEGCARCWKLLRCGCRKSAARGDQLQVIDDDQGSRPLSRLSRRDLAPISITVEEAESSIHSGDSANQ